MINLCSAIDSFYFTSFSPLTDIFKKLPGGSDSQMALVSKAKTKKFSLEHTCHFDFKSIEDSFECEFVEMPDSIRSPDDFRKWIMEMKFE